MHSPWFQRGVAALCALAMMAEPALTATVLRAPNTRPAVDTDEAGLWFEADKAERAAKGSAELDTDVALTAYVQSIACKVAAEYCPEMRVYVMDRPYFNATVAPNGYVEVWSGLLLRVTDEAELAFVLGHEITHFAENDSIESQRALKARATVGIIFAAVSPIGAIAYLGAMASFFSYSREQESQADAGGQDRMVVAGYDPASSITIWKSLLAETQSSDFPRTRREATRASIFNTHPIDPARIEAMTAQMRARGAAAGESGRVRYRAIIRPHLTAWLRDELRRRDYGESLHLIDRLAADGEDLGVLGYFRGEAYRLRRGPGDAALAIAAYEAAQAYPDAPVAVWRELGNLYQAAGDKPRAKTAFETYLARATEAQDRWMVEAALKAVTGENVP